MRNTLGEDAERFCSYQFKSGNECIEDEQGPLNQPSKRLHPKNIIKKLYKRILHKFWFLFKHILYFL